jgi:hypothetical protein
MSSEITISEEGLSRLRIRSDGSPTPYKENSIPKRIKCFVPLKMDTSKVEGRGFFALKAIKTGEFVFSITNPLVTVVSFYVPFHHSLLMLEICHFSTWNLGSFISLRTENGNECIIVRYLALPTHDLKSLSVLSLLSTSREPAAEHKMDPNFGPCVP